MKFSIYSAMMLGPRSVQEDCIFDGVARWQDEDFESRRESFSDTIMLAVCDGMGGHEKGDEASRFVCEKLKKISHDRITDAQSLNDLLTGIQNSALEALPRNSGTTVAGLLVRDSRVMAFNAGDSRVYKLTANELKYISHDHSLVQEMVDKSMITGNAAKDHPLKNLIDFGFGPIFAEAWKRHGIHIHEEPLEDNATYLLCTDGLTGVMTDRRIHYCMMQFPNDKGTHLIAAMKRKGLADNMSFIIVEIHQK